MMAQTAMDRHAPSEQLEETYALENHPCHRTARFRELRQSIRRQQRQQQIATNARSRVPQVLSGFPSRPAWPSTVRFNRAEANGRIAHTRTPRYMSMHIRAIWLNVSNPLIVWQRRVPRAPPDLIFRRSIKVLGAWARSCSRHALAGPTREPGS